MKIESIDDITLTHIKGNWRYKIFKYKGKTYLLDGSTYWFSFLLIFTKWIFLPINAYEVDDMIIKGLKEEESVQGVNITWNIIFTIMFVSAMVAKIIERVVSKFNLGENFNIIYLYMIPIIFIGYFTISRYCKKRKLLSLLNEQYNKKRIRFRLHDEEDTGKDFLFPVLFPVIILLMISRFAIKNIITKRSDVKDYLMYFLAFFIWFVMTMSTTMRTEHLVGATITIEDKRQWDKKYNKH